MLTKGLKSVLIYEIGMSVVFYGLGVYQGQDYKMCVLLQFILGIIYIIVFVNMEKRRKNDRDKRVN